MTKQESRSFRCGSINDIQLRNENKFRTPIHGRNFQGTTTCVGALYPEGNVQVYWTWKWFDFQKAMQTFKHRAVLDTAVSNFRTSDTSSGCGIRVRLSPGCHTIFRISLRHTSLSSTKSIMTTFVLSQETTRGTRHRRSRIHPSEQSRLARKLSGFRIRINTITV